MEEISQPFKLIPLKKILIALDFDPSTQKVHDSGFSSAKTLNAEIILLHVLTDQIYYHSRKNSPSMGLNSFSDTAFFHINDIDGLKKAAQYFLNKVKNNLNDASIQTIIEEGDLAEAIFNTSKDLNIDIIVLGSHTRRWLEQILLATNSVKIFQQTTIPMFSVSV